MEEWEKKIRDICRAIGPTGEAVAKEIIDIVDEYIDQAYERGRDSGMEQGYINGCCNIYGSDD